MLPRFIRITDDRGRDHELRSPPRRIVSLVPSDTYSLICLGAADRLVGRTRYCVAPADVVAGIPEVGGTKDADLAKIADLRPDLVIANQEENSRGDIEKLDALGLRVLVSFPRTVAAGLAHLARLARALGLDGGAEPARSVVGAAYRTHHAALAARGDARPVRTFCPIWMDPLMTIHGATFISNVLELVGAENVFARRERRYPLAADVAGAAPLPAERVAGRDVRYPRVTLQEILEAQPDLVILPDEPHPFTEADAQLFRGLDIPAAKSGQVVFCDGKDLMWYGARSFEGLARLRALVDAARAGSPDQDLLSSVKIS